MTNNSDNLEEITNPTWEYPIKSFFNDIDVNHMLTKSKSWEGGPMNLSKYEDVTSDNKTYRGRTWKEGILERISDKSMPVAPSQVWSDEMIDLYKLWANNGYPEKRER